MFHECSTYSETNILTFAGEGIYFAAKSGRMCAEAIVAGSAQGTKMAGEKDIRVYLDKCALL